MEAVNKYYLKEDVKSNFHRNKESIIYGEKGDKVTEIARSEHVLVVEDKKGERFPVNIEKLIKIN